MKIHLTTEEGYPKDKAPGNPRHHRERAFHLVVTGDDAPVKAVQAIMQKYGVTKEEL